jgi:hypothetical protein
MNDEHFERCNACWWVSHEKNDVRSLHMVKAFNPKALLELGHMRFHFAWALIPLKSMASSITYHLMLNRLFIYIDLRETRYPPPPNELCPMHFWACLFAPYMVFQRIVLHGLLDTIGCRYIGREGR